MNAIQTEVQKLKVRYIRIDGSTSTDCRSQYVEEFQNEKDCQVAILSILAAGVGLTLTAASIVVIAEMA